MTRMDAEPTRMDFPTLVNHLIGDRSLRKLAEQAGMSTSNLNQRMRIEWKASVDPVTVRGLAAALPCTERALWIAAGRSCGFDMDSDESAFRSLMRSGTDRWSSTRTQRMLTLVAAEIDDQDREDRLAVLEAETADLRAQIATLERAAKRRPKV